MPYLMGGFPDLGASRAVGEACIDAGANLLELGVPFSDPLADGPVIHAAGTHALREGATPGAVLEICATLAERMPVALMVYANLLVGHDAFVESVKKHAVVRGPVVIVDLTDQVLDDPREPYTQLLVSSILPA